MMQPVRVKPVVWCAVFLLVLGAFCPMTAAIGDDVALEPLAMGRRGDSSAVDQNEPQVSQPTLMIRLGTAHFDPLYRQPVAATGLADIQAYEEGATGYYVVQFDGPVQAQWKTALQQLGAEIFDYVPDFAFMVRMPSDIEATVRAMANVRWVGVFQPSYRISQSALGLMYTASADAAAPPVTLRINVFPGVNLADVTARLQNLGANINETSSTTNKTTIQVEIPAANISGLPGIDGIKWIEPAPQWKLFNNASTDTMNVRSKRDTHGLYGLGQTVGVADTGLDQGSTSPGSLHDDFEDGSGGSRVLTILDTAGDGDPEDTHSHGTHVAGSVLGNGDLSGANPAGDSFPPTCFAGIAPKANLVFQSLIDGGGNLILPPDLNTLFGDAQSAGADLHTNSWGASVNGQYTASSQDVDEFMWNNKDFLIHFSAGNSGIDMNADGVVDFYSLGSPATAKNCLTVGASEGDRPGGVGYNYDWGVAWPNDFPADPIASDHLSDNDGGLAAFSSRGPTLDGRHKPDIVAPGTNILSARSSDSSAGTGWGVYNSNYIWMGGTSMSCPLTAGASALMREYLINQQGMATPSAAMIKAALLNSAEDITPGQYGTGAAQEIPDSPVPNNVEGWGRVNIGDGVYPAAPANIMYFDENTGINTGEYQDYPFSVTTAGAPLKINLVWTDYWGTPAAQGGLVNDLDLHITDPNSTVHYPDQASQKASLSTLYYDSGNPQSALTGYDAFAMRFTPASYPAHVDSVTVFPYNTVPGTNIDVVVYSDAGGTPGTALYTASVPYVPIDNVTIPVEGVEIASGDFYVSVEVDNTSSQGIVRDAASSGGRSYYDSGSGWTTTASYTWFIRANVRSADYSTSYDRVNNTLGITIPSPTVGQYTVRVAGYSVAQGPQPYALVASGNITQNAGGSLQYDSAAYSVSESGTTATITVTRTGGSDGTVSIDYATSNGSATAGSDYTAASDTLTWPDGDSTPRSFTVNITDDSTGEADETVNLTLSNVTGGAAIGTPSTAVLTILDDEVGQVQFSSASQTFGEGADFATVTVERTNGSNGAITVDCATSDGTATAGSDYTATSQTLNMADGETSATFSVPLTNDSSTESNETFTLTLSGPTGGASLGTPSTMTITIRDNDSDDPPDGGGGGGGGGCFIDTLSLSR